MSQGLTFYLELIRTGIGYPGQYQNQNHYQSRRNQSGQFRA